MFSPPSNEISHLPCGPQIALPLFPDSSCATLRSTKLKLLMLQKSGEPSNAYDQSPQLAGSTANSTVNCFFLRISEESTKQDIGKHCANKNFKTTIIWVFPKIGVRGNPKWMVYNGKPENPIKMDDLGVPPFKETPI